MKFKFIIKISSFVLKKRRKIQSHDSRKYDRKNKAR